MIACVLVRALTLAMLVFAPCCRCWLCALLCIARHRYKTGKPDDAAYPSPEACTWVRPEEDTVLFDDQGAQSGDAVQVGDTP